MTMDAPSSTTARSLKPIGADGLEAAFAAREAWAFEAAYGLYRRQLFGAALAVMHDRGDAEDCVHDTLVRLWQRGHAYTAARGSVAGFLTVCVRNEALSRVRKRANRLRIERERVHPEPAESPGDEVVERKSMEAALQTLNDSQRETIRLAYYAGLTHEEIAQRMQEPLGTVKSRISAALRSLRGYLRAQGEDV